MDEPTLEELQRAARPSFRMSSAGRRRPDQRGGGEALETIGGALAGSVPAGLAGLAMLPFRGPAGAAETVERVQDVFTPMPTTEGGVRATMGLAQGLAPLGAPAQAVGDLTLRATGSPLAATAAEIALDPLNALGIAAAAKPAARAAAAGARAAGRGARRAGAAAVENLGPKVAELAESYMRRSGMTPEITTYHGTPHTFAPEPGLPLGRFRAEKIGSGEGNQMYGHGIYVAENPAVGKRYAEQLANRDASNQGRLNAHANAKRLAELQGGANYAADDIRFVLETNDDHPQKKLLQDTLSFLESGKYKEPLEKTGSFYSIDLPDTVVNRMLDWDAAISEQPELVQKALQNLAAKDRAKFGEGGGFDYYMADPDSYSGESIYQYLAEQSGGQKEASVLLQSQGVPGVRYFDEFSRDRGEGTRNYVVFPGEEQNLRILERDGVKAENAVKKAQGGAVEGSDMSYSQVVDRIKSGLVQGGMDSGQAMEAALRMAEAKMKSGGAVLMAGGGDAERELTLQARNRSLAALDRGLAPRARKAWDGPMPNRPVINGRAMVSAEELADFRRQFGADKTLRDLRNADRGLTRRGETPSAQDMRARGPQGPSEAPASPYSDPSRVMEGVAASQREIARPGRDAVEPVAPELALALAPRIAQLLGVSASALRARLAAAGKDWRNTPPRGADKAKWDAIVKQIDEAYPQAAQRPARVETPPLGTGRSAPDLDPTFGVPQPGVRGVMERPEPAMQAGGPVLGNVGRAAARAAQRASAKAAKEAAEKAAEAKAPTPLVLPPAAPMTKEQMRPIAQRMAAQTTGQFVRPDPRVSFNPAGKSRKVFDRERDLPVGVSFKAPESPAPVVDLEKHLGSVLVGIPGDPTIGSAARAGVLSQAPTATAELKRLGDVDFEQGVQLFGGPRYGAGMPDNRFWASGLGAARAVQNRVTDLAEMHDAPVLGQYIKMSPESTNYALHNLDALLAYQQPEKLNKAQRELLEGEIRKGSPKYGQFPNFAGFDDPMDVLLQAQIDPNLRKHIAETLMKPTVTEKLGLRQGSDVLFGITEPSLRDVEVGTSGFSIGKMQPGVDLRQYPSAHPTYDVDIPGEFIGQSKYPIPAEIAFPSSMAYARSKLKPGVQEFNMLKFMGPREKIDRQYVDQMKMFEELMKEYTGKKKGGAARKAKAGALDKAAG
jgi:hypothetical protein